MSAAPVVETGADAGAARCGGVLAGSGWVRRYRRRWLRADVIAGITVGGLLVPQSMAYAELAEVPAVVGLHAALWALLVHAAIGSSRHLGVGPEPGTALLAAGAVGGLAAPDGADYLRLMGVLAALVGVVCLVAAALRLGVVARLLSHPMLVGYLTGVGLTLLASQLAALLALDIAAEDPAGRVAEAVAEMGGASLTAAAVGTATLVITLVLRRRRPRWPGALVAVATTAVLVHAWPGAPGIALVGTVPGGLPVPSVPTAPWSDVLALVPAALAIALVGYADNVLTARSVAERQGYEIDPQRELAALGAVNAVSASSGGFPLSSSASRTALPAALGSYTQLVGVVAAATLAATLLWLGPVVGAVPRATIAGLVVAAAISIIDLAGFRSLARHDRPGLVVAATTAVVVILVGVLPGVAAALAVQAVVALSRHLRRPRDLGPTAGGRVALPGDGAKNGR